jgi:O-antigen/teichoic acid export membrane protein
MPDRVARGRAHGGAHAKPSAWRAHGAGQPITAGPGRVLGLLPPGTLPVGAGLMVLGIGMYTHLAVAGHRLSAPGMAALSVLWSLVFLLGLGVFLPVEQELIRLVAARTAVGEGITPVVRRFCALSAVILAVMFVPLAAAAGPLARTLFGGEVAMVAALACACVAMAVTTVSRGVLAGLGRFTAYGGQLAADGGGRILLALALGLSGTRSALVFGFILTVAPLISVLFTLGPVARGLRPGQALPWRVMSGRLCLLIATMLLAQVIINAAVINVRLLSPGDPAVVGALLAASVLARVPLFVFTSLQTALLPGLAGAIAAGNRARFRTLLGRGCEAVLVLGLAGGVPATVLGPWLTRVLFGARPVLGDASFAWLAFGTLCYMLAMVLGQGAMALARHRDQLLAWAAGVTVLAVITVIPGEVTTRVVAAYALGCGTVATALAVVLIRHPAGADGGAAREVRAWPMPNR